jgi:hypothetical protein
MATLYLIQPGTRVSVSQDGVNWKDRTLKAQLTFDAPVETTATHLIFADGQWRIRVSRGDVALVKSEGAGGTIRWGA